MKILMTRKFGARGVLGGVSGAFHPFSAIFPKQNRLIRPDKGQWGGSDQLGNCLSRPDLGNFPASSEVIFK